MIDQRYYTREEVCGMLGGVTYQTLWRWMSVGKIPAPMKVGRRLLFKKSDFDRHLDDRLAHPERY